MKPIVYLIPSLLNDEAVETIPAYIIEAVKDCHVFFVENDRTARRYLKRIWKEAPIDDFEWFVIGKKESAMRNLFVQKIEEGKNVGIISEAGCPGVADPGQLLIAAAHEMDVQVKPLVGPNSILLALMASGMNGQRFQFVGYLPIRENERITAIKELENESRRNDCTQIFIETPYRNNQLMECVFKTCKPSTRLCIAADISGKGEWIRTKTIEQWRRNKTNIHKHPAIFLIYAAKES